MGVSYRRGYRRGLMAEVSEERVPTGTDPLVNVKEEPVMNDKRVQLEHKSGGSVVGVQEYKLYPIRYLMLLALFVLNVSNGIMWLSFSPVPSLTASYYDISLSDVDWFSNSYFIASLLIGFVSIVVLDVFGLRTAVIIGSVCNLLGALIRYISTLDFILCSGYSKAGFMTAIIGQVITAFAQPFFLYAPAKLANTWFGSKERGLCTDLASVANPLGIAIAQIVSPYIVTEVQEISLMLWVYIIPAGIGAILSLCFLYRSSPLTPPTAGGDTPHLPFIKGLISAFKNINFWVLLMTWGIGAGVFNALLIIIPQYVCPYGYSNKAAGLWGSLLIICGLVGATVSGILIGKTKLYKEIGIGNLFFTILALICFIEVAIIEDIPAVVAITLCVVGFFALGFIPVAMELGVEVTFPAAEATSSGLLWSSAQIFGFLFVTIGQNISPVISSDALSSNKCQVTLPTSNETALVCDGDRNVSSHVLSDNAKPQNWTNCGLMLVAMATLAYGIFVIFFKPDYKRLKYEENTKRNTETGNNEQ